MGFSRQEHWNELPYMPGALPHPGIEPVSLMSLALSGGFFMTSATWAAPLDRKISQMNYKMKEFEHLLISGLGPSWIFKADRQFTVLESILPIFHSEAIPYHHQSFQVFGRAASPPLVG